jgi:DNA repair exonuclease SbcCD nuclease subunit
VAAGLPQFSMADLGELEIQPELLEPFDYVAMGHYHNFSRVSDRVWYAGSTERLSLAERDSKKGFIEFQLAPLRVRFQEVGARVMIDLPPVDARNLRVAELLTALHQRLDECDAPEKIIRLTVANTSDELMRTFPAGAIAELKQKAFSLDLRFERVSTTSAGRSFGRSSIGRLEDEFLGHLGTVDLSDADRALYAQEGLRYLHEDEPDRSIQ